MSYLDKLKNLKSATPPSVESIETPLSHGFDTFDTAQDGHSQKSDPAFDTLDTATSGHYQKITASENDERHRLWLVTRPDGTRFSLSRNPPGPLAEIQADYPGCLVEIETDPTPGADIERHAA